MRYFRPQSLTWWAGICSVATGIASMAGAGQWTSDIGSLISLLAGGADSSPAGLIFLGLGLIGIRDKLSRVFGDADDH